MKQMIASIAALALGIGIGVGIGMAVSKSKVNESKIKIEALQAQMEASKEESEKTIRKAAEEIARLNKSLNGYQAMFSPLKNELERVKGELAQLKSQNIQPVVTAPPAETTTKPVTNPAAAVPPSVPSTEYIVKDGDSLWKIAEQQLGDGMRYKEILLLNPAISENQTLIVGTKLKIPSQKN